MRSHLEGRPSCGVAPAGVGSAGELRLSAAEEADSYAGVAFDGDALVVDQGVAVVAEGDQVGQVGAASALAVVDVVGVEFFGAPAGAAAIAVACEDFATELGWGLGVTLTRWERWLGKFLGRSDLDYFD